MKIISCFALVVMCFGTIFASAKSMSYGIVGDMGRWNTNSKMIQDSMLRLKTNHLVMPGDNLYKLREGYRAVWAPWLDAGFVFSVVALGNHTLGYKEEVDFFKMPGEYYSKVDNENDIRFIVLNSDNRQNVESQMTFLKNELVSSPNKFNFIVYHHPSFTVSNVHKWSEKEQFQRAIRGIVKQHTGKIAGLIWGHDHIAATYDFEGVPVFLSGSAQDPRLGDIGPQDTMGYKFERKWLAPQGLPYWLKMESTGSFKKSFIFKFIRAEDDQVMCTMKLTHNSSLEYRPDCQLKK